MTRHLLLEAIRAGDERLAKEIVLSGGYDECLDSQLHRDGTALFFCCSRGHLELTSLLVERGASLEATTKWRATPLHAAVDNNHLEIVRYLVNIGADINSRTDRGDTPLHLAAFRGYSDIVHCLVQFGSDVTLVNEMNLTPLKEAIIQGHFEIEHFLRAVHNLNYSTNHNADPSHMVSLTPPTDLPSPLPSLHEPCPPIDSPSVTALDNRPRGRLAMNISPLMLQRETDSTNVASNAGHHDNFFSRLPTTAHPPSPSSSYWPGTHAPSTEHPRLRVPEENLDSSEMSPLTVRKQLTVPTFADRQRFQRRNSTASSVSMLSDYSNNSGPRSDWSSAESSIGDVSSLGDVKRDDVEVPEMAERPLSCSCGVAEGVRRMSQPDSNSLAYCNDNSNSNGISNSSNSKSTLNRTLSTPAASIASASEFSDMFNSSLFSLGSMAPPPPPAPASPSSAPSRSRTNDFSSLNFNLNNSTINGQSSSSLSPVNVYRPHPGDELNFLHGHNAIGLPRPPSIAEEGDPQRRRHDNRYYSNTETREGPTGRLRERKSASQGGNDFSNGWSLEATPLSNDLSSIKPSSSSSSSSHSPSMTFLNIPLHD